MVISITYKINTYPAELIYLNFHPLEDVSRYCDPKLQITTIYLIRE